MKLRLNKIEIEQIKRLCTLSEQKEELTAALLKIIYEKKWFKLFVPKKLGGLELNLIDALKTEEQLAYIDGSLGWTVTLCAGANFFVGYMDKHIAGKLFSAKNICLGGSGAVSGVAVQTKDGYEITGSWKYATGAPHLTHFTANCVVKKNGVPVLKPDGTTLVRSFYFTKNEVSVVNDWHTFGLKATASQSFSVKKLKVKEERAFVIDPNCATLKLPAYTYPFKPLAETTLAVNTLGMASHLLDNVEAIIHQKKTNQSQLQVAIKALQIARNHINKLRLSFYTIVEQSWNELLTTKQLSPKTIKQITIVSRQLVKTCRVQASIIYPYCGVAATSKNTEINRIFRDLFTASQHGLLLFDK